MDPGISLPKVFVSVNEEVSRPISALHELQKIESSQTPLNFHKKSTTLIMNGQGAAFKMNFATLLIQCPKAKDIDSMTRCVHKRNQRSIFRVKVNFTFPVDGDSRIIFKLDRYLVRFIKIEEKIFWPVI